MLILTTGTCKDKAVLALEADYVKRLKKPWLVDVRALNASKATNPAQARTEEATTQLAALQRLGQGHVPVLLHEHAKPMDTTAFAAKLNGWLNLGQTPVFMIGGAAGFDTRVLAQVAQRLSLSPLTFPHQLCRVLPVEQIYRAQTLATGHPYHRA